MASSLELEISSNVELVNIGAVIRLATEAAPTKAEAQASAGHVGLAIPANSPRKFSISQHYGSDFTNGLTLADVLAPNTAYKLYLYFPAGRITTTAEITGLNVIDDMAVVPFSTAVLPAEGDAKWLSSNGSASVASLDSFYFMEEQTGIAVCYFYTNFVPFIVEWSVKPSDDLPLIHNLATYTSGAVGLGGKFNFAYGSISGYTSDSLNNYVYWIGGDKTESLTNQIQITITDNRGKNTAHTVPVTRY
ncbi:hypothetical protein P0082_11840 [Candidatus Haliotispira prima]|uniref:Uncharacterized protein n=1 Tax=Candidatus Haliotispira prima TaxID=3034016 RepID=A0ABY8MHT2_9SPIO|nr:hypothetical protein P0082_07850 [Candidatus Haliotispira prima]WGK69156.1 hypothetical protein P0082_11840 [Candidatus Haliotispira prima]